MLLRPKFLIPIVSLAILSLVAVAFVLFRPQVSNNCDRAVVPSKCDAEINVINEKVIEQGYIRKEPDDRDLGSEFIYIFYFDEPFLLCTNSSGRPQEISSIELLGVQDPRFDINSLLDKHVEVFGSLAWGYAESRVISVQSITP